MYRCSKCKSILPNKPNGYSQWNQSTNRYQHHDPSCVFCGQQTESKQENKKIIEVSKMNIHSFDNRGPIIIQAGEMNKFIKAIKMLDTYKQIVLLNNYGHSLGIADIILKDGSTCKAMMHNSEMLRIMMQTEGIIDSQFDIVFNDTWYVTWGLVNKVTDIVKECREKMDLADMLSIVQEHEEIII